jgi:protease-4
MANGSGTRPRRRWRRLLVVALLMTIVFAAARHFLFAHHVPDGSFVLVELEGDYPERATDDVVSWLTSSKQLSLLDLLLLLRDLREDDRIAGVVLRVRSLGVGWAKAQEIRDALLAYRESGKPLYAYLEQEFASSTLEYYVASAAPQVYLPPGAAAPVSGIVGQYFFLGGVWDKLDIDMEVQKIREYKTAGDMIANREMSPQHREMADWLLDSVFEQLVGGIARGRALDDDIVREVIDASPTTAAELEARGLTDGVKFLADLRTELVGEDKDKDFLKADEYRAAGGKPAEKTPEHEIAVVYGVGTVINGESEDPAVGGASMGADTLAKSFDDAANDDDAKAIVFRIDSPGGSALASDLIWSAVRKAKQTKPVIVSMSDVAGSGGYYVAAGASRIVAQPGTLTGSIGVVLSKPNIRGFLHLLGINTATLSRGRLAEIASVTDSLTTDERERIVDAMNSIYDLFVQRVAEGRSMTPQQVDAVGGGRVFTGEQARERGLVDDLGGFLAAIDAAKAAAEIPTSEKVRLVFYPRHKPLAERLLKFLAVRLQVSVPAWMRQVDGLLKAYEFPPGSILTLMPFEVSPR